MACIQRVRTAQETQLFPNQIASEQQSLVVIKKLLAIAVSGITYLRGLFPEKAYGSKFVEDQKVMVLREERSCPGACQIVEWLQGCFDAIQKKYLRAAIVTIYADQDNPLTVTELYHFRIQYNVKGTMTMDIESNNSKNNVMMSSCNTRKASILLLRKLYTLMHNLGPLPDNVCVSMKLAYYDQVTPQDYHPPGFKDSEGNSVEFESEPVKLSLGEVMTPFHTLKIDLATEKQRLEQVESVQSVQLMEKWIVDMQEDDFQPQLCEGGAKPKGSTNLDNTDMETSCQEKTLSSASATEETPQTVNKKRSAATMAFKYDIPNSQELHSSSTSKKKRKFSEPKESF